MKTLYITAILLIFAVPLNAESFPISDTKTILPDSVPVKQEASSLHPTVKTNCLLWAATLMNAEGELFVTPNISVALSAAWCPWFISSKIAFRCLALLPEGRWWFRPGGTGHFFGVHVSAAWFNVRCGDYRYQDVQRPLLGAGLTYGYALPLRSGWGLEFSIGAGFASMRYDRFHNIDNGALIDTRHTTWFGIDKASVSVTYQLPAYNIQRHR